MQRSQRLAFTAATAPTQIVVATVLGVVLSRVGRNSSSGWGDVIGVLVGVVFGAGIGLAAIVVLVGRVQQRPTWHLVVLALLALPSALLASAITAIVGVGFWAAYVVYLVACTAAVWWWSGRVSGAAAHPSAGDAEVV